MKENRRKRISKWLGITGAVIFIGAVLVSVYMMAHNMGHAPGIDFGPGQYYYTDIPGWQKYFMKDAFHSRMPIGVLIGLFFAWGFLMYRLWCFLDGKWKDEEEGVSQEEGGTGI